ncbi:Protein CHROMATIN REMODELING 20 [Hibiscus syriacus]|uniref:Protein CHROMATIN REMODELING 20 n=1 Tax=Hibiscus syriacus TaxID=106335 RepID=A0A6A3A7V7_HIBSY|nr:Protein CHROMATIN REMODELING 20 [Hibiscus syriacus]
MRHSFPPSNARRNFHISLSMKGVFNEVMDSKLEQSQPLEDDPNSVSNKEHQEERDCVVPNNENGLARQTLKNDTLESFESCKPDRTWSSPNSMSSEHFESDKSGSGELVGSKRSNEDMEANENNKKARTDIIDSDDEVDGTVKDELISSKLEDQFTMPEKSGASVGVESITEKFICTACHKLAVEVQQHRLLKVIICGECKCFLEEKMRRKASGWQCCSCLPTLLQKLTSELERAIAFQDATVSSSDSDSENSDTDDINTSVSSKREPKKKIRRILDDAELGEETKRKIAIEKERQERLKSMQFSAKYNMMNSSSCSRNLLDEASLEVLGDANTGYIVNVRRENGEDAVRIPSSISAKLKIHQIAGIRFMWENIIQSITKVKSGDKGLGCILAHTMGLGKTFQVIAFLYTAMRIVDLGLKTALIVTPVNVLHNWRQEFMKWRPSELKPLRVFMLEDVPRERRAELLSKWIRKGGIFLIGYTAFRNLSFGKHVKDRNVARDICYALQGGTIPVKQHNYNQNHPIPSLASLSASQFAALEDGPDILVCDEAHTIKNTRADTTQALKQVKCQRRIALTGSPLQNNLMEYYCMVDFVREGFLGSSHDFQNPIENGQHTNSTHEDVKIMNQRSHILYEQLKGFVQRMDMSVVKNDLPPKTVFVITVKLSPLQRKLYKRFLDVHGFANDRPSNEKIRKSFFAGYQALAQIWNHPGILQLNKDAVENFLADESSSDENIDYNVDVGDKVDIFSLFPESSELMLLV